MADINVQINPCPNQNIIINSPTEDNIIINTNPCSTANSNTQEFSTPIITGSNNQQISFPYNFSSIPNVLVTIEVTENDIYLWDVNNITVSGYIILFSDIIKESGVISHTYASL